MAGFLGMSGTGRFSSDERPLSWRQGILMQMPNGDVPLTAINSKGRSRTVDDPEFNFWSKDLELQGGAIVAGEVFKEASLTNAYGAETAAVGITVYCKVTAAVVSHFKAGHTVLILNTSNNSQSSFGKVVALDVNGASSYVAVKLRLASASGYLAASTQIDIIGSAHPEGALVPDAMAYAPTKFTNYTQIFRNSLEITRTMRKTRLRTKEAYQEAKREAALYHAVEMEMAALYSEKSEVTGDNGQLERTTQGGISFVNEHESANVLDFPTDSNLTWKQGGEDWFDDDLEQVFRFGRSEKLAFAGHGALRGIQKLVKQSGQFMLEAETGAYGVKVVRWTTPFGDLLLKRHPLFTYKSHRTNDMFIYEPENLQTAIIDDTFFKSDSDNGRKGGFIAIDGTKEEYITEMGYEWHFPQTMMYLTGVGLDGN